MTDPYKVLELTPNATDEEVKEAYRKMAKKYHPDKYAGSPLADVANEKMKEVNEAYDQIMKERKAAKEGKTTGNASGYGGSYGGAYQTASGFRDVRILIQNGRIADAEQLLDGVSQEQRNAEWHFLKGIVLNRRGWNEEAFKHINAAVEMDPNNMEYRAVFNQMNGQRGGVYGGYNPNAQAAANAGCNFCSAMLCADCCCHCCSGR